MPYLLWLSGAIDRLNDAFGRFAEWMVLFSCLVSAANAVIRYSLNYSSNAYLEIQWHMFAAMVMLGASCTLRRNEHVRVDIIYSQISERTRARIDIAGYALFMLPIMAFLCWMSWPLFWMSLKSNETSMNVGGLYTWPAKLLLPLGFFLLSLQGLSELIKRLAALRGVIVLSTKYERPLQ